MGPAAPALALVGPTASGKTAISLAVAPGAGAEIVCVDSMTVYRGMDVGTAKPSPADRARVPHHLLDLCDPGEAFSVAEFQRAARSALAAIRARGRVPLLVGGSGLYLRAVVDDLEFPPADPEVRARLAREETGALVGRLRSKDPGAAEKIDPANRRRVLRALEVIEITGRPFSSFRRGWACYDAPLTCAGRAVPREVLLRRIEARVRGMIARGLLEEVAGLLARGYRAALTAPKAIGYREAIAHLDGATTAEEMVEETIRATRRLVGRQMTWFRRDPRIRWFDASDIGRAAEAIGAYYGSSMEARACGS
ncbi:MAG: tRNA (adenosine(37)-N6)-dimethylallyltransferase MiaA [Acidobacteria bacterium]|nr:tRNA (adenosine(37)-N6)-dimethylallyltransferase MiaA [Acidobacteriota bacterium]